MGEAEISKFLTHLPVVLTNEEVAAVLRQLSGVSWIMASLLYGAGSVELPYAIDRKYHKDVVEGRWVIETSRRKWPWEVIVEPDFQSELLVVITAYPYEEESQ